MASYHAEGTVVATYQGIPCLEASYENPQGTSSGSGYVVMTCEQFGQLTIDGSEAWDPIPAGPSGKTELRETSGQVPRLGAGLKIRGDLAFTRRGDKSDESVVLVGIYVTDAGVREIQRSAETVLDRGKVRIPLGDVRMLWGRGDLCGPHNVRKEGVAVAGEPGGTIDRAEAAGLSFLAESLRPDGEPYTLLDLVRICLRRLPGRLELAGGQDAIAARAIIPENVAVAGESALDILHGLLDAWNFRLVVPLFSNKAQLWRFDHGKPVAEDDGGVLRSLSFPTNGDEKIQVDPKAVPERMRLRRYFFRPRAVRVVGAPVVREVRIDGLEPVGEINGIVRPLDECLAAINVRPAVPKPKVNTSDPRSLAEQRLRERADEAKTRQPMTRADLAKWVLLNQDEQQAWRDHELLPEAVEKLRTWAFKWYRLPSWALAFTPILPARARSIDGRRVPPAVFADSFFEVPYKVWGQAYDRAVEELNRAKDVAVITIQGGELLGIVNFRQIVENALSPSPFAFLGGGNVSEETQLKVIEEVTAKYKAERQAVKAQIAIESRAIAESEGNEIRFFNRRLQRFNPSDVHVTADGIVKFSRVVGCVQIAPGRDAIGPIASLGGIGKGPESDVGGRAGSNHLPGVPVYVSEGATLETSPRVSILFAYESTPRARKAMRTAGPGLAAQPDGDKSADGYRDLYSFLGTLTAGGRQVLHLNPTGIDPDGAEALYPRIVRHDLREFIDVDGVTNRGELDAVARTIVRRELEGDTQTLGDRGEASRFYPIQPTGAVVSVSWALERAEGGFLGKTRWNTGDETQLRSVPQTQERSTGTAGLGTGPGSVSASREGGGR